MFRSVFDLFPADLVQLTVGFFPPVLTLFVLKGLPVEVIQWFGG